MQSKAALDSFKTKTSVKFGGRAFVIYKTALLKNAGLPDPGRLPFSLRILLENLLRLEDGQLVRKQDIEALATWNPKAKPEKEIAFTPARVILQDFTGVPCVVDLAAMRDAIRKIGGDPKRINPLQPVELVIDHSVQVDFFGTPGAFSENSKLEFERYQERYQFLRWGQQAFKNFSVVPPGTGIVHQVNLEYLAKVVFKNEVNGELCAYPDRLGGPVPPPPMTSGGGVDQGGVQIRPHQ